jgi:DNA-directed RNA polymerase subunit RPC12/RpoP
MDNYEQLVKALRLCQFGECGCGKCYYKELKGDWCTEDNHPEFFDCDDKLKLDAADAIEALDAKADYWMGQAQEEYEKRLRQMPKRGEWIEDRTEIVCSKCHARFSDEIIFMNRNMENEALKYCPNCGAKMEVQE